MHKIIRKTLGAAAALAVAAGIVIVPAVTGTPGTGAGPEAAQAVPYKIPRGTWGGTTYYRDVHAYWAGDAEVRFRQWNRNWYDGTRWVNKQYYLGYYYSGVTRA